MFNQRQTQDTDSKCGLKLERWLSGDSRELLQGRGGEVIGTRLTGKGTLAGQRGSGLILGKSLLQSKAGSGWSRGSWDRREGDRQKES